jgi:hypothetical protein
VIQKLSKGQYGVDWLSELLDICVPNGSTMSHNFVAQNLFFDYAKPQRSKEKNDNAHFTQLNII